MNLNKIGILFTAIDPDVLISDFAKVKEDNGNYYGTKGSIRIENNKIHLYYKRTNDEIKFSANMFLMRPVYRTIRTVIHAMMTEDIHIITLMP